MEEPIVPHRDGIRNNLSFSAVTKVRSLRSRSELFSREILFLPFDKEDLETSFTKKDAWQSGDRLSDVNTWTRIDVNVRVARDDSRIIIRAR